ncbi:uncharacterized protein LOC129605818 isoform X2 [Condylostylus longicornis]|uniref:uncharacterized protein LOC129605818 isoform X2 n=1 Tax=Condylostylus longicornis TaxID=2530218 RepID=UPI00244E52CA|nr:uncharacterized protein LOC129605818 isoform X2 [Condylostylus longicornis]
MKLKLILGYVVERYHHSNVYGNNRTVILRNEEIGNGSDIENEESITNLINEDSELSGLSHVDAPNDVMYMVCGVVIAMLLVGLIIILVAVTINKLRKREETSAVSPPSSGRHHVEAHHQTNLNNYHNNINSNHHSQHHQLTTTTTIATISSQQQQQQQQNQVLSNNENGIIQNNIVSKELPQDSWVFPPLPPQPNIYCMNTTDALAHLQDKSGFKRFRTQFSGRFKRLVAKKTQEPPAIPPELRPQLKTIYVY